MLATYFLFFLWCMTYSSVHTLPSASATVSSSRCSSVSRTGSATPRFSRSPSVSSTPTRSRSTSFTPSNLDFTSSRSGRPTTGFATLTASPSILFPSFSLSSTVTLCLSATGSPTVSLSASLFPSISTLSSFTRTTSVSSSPSRCPSASVSPTASLSLASKTSSTTLTISPVKTVTLTSTPILPCFSSTPQRSQSGTHVQSLSVAPTQTSSNSFSPSISPTVSSSKSQSSSPSSTFSIFSPSALASFSPSVSPSASSSPTFSNSLTHSITVSLSISSVFSFSASPSAPATPSATQSGAPCNCERNSAGCQSATLVYQWPESVRGGGREVFPPPTTKNTTRGVVSWPLLKSTLSISLPAPPSQKEVVTVNCSVSGAKAAPFSLSFTPGGGGNMSKGARACAGAACAAFVAESDLTTIFTLVPLAPVFFSTFTPIQCDIASFRPPTLPCDQGYSLYPRLATVFLEAVALPSNFSLLGGVILAVNSSQTPEIQYQDLGNPTNNLNFPPYTPPLGCSLEAPCGDLNASLLSNLTSSGPPTTSSNFSFTSGISQHLLLLASPAFPFPSTLAISIGNVNGTRGAILCRGVRDAPCTITDVQCCRVNWNTPNIASLTTPSFYRGSGSICAGNFWCQAGMILSDGRDLSSYAVPIGDSPYSTLSLINTTRDRVAAVEGGAAGPDSGVFNTSDPLYFSTSYPPAVNLSSVLNPTLSYKSNLPSPLAFATTYGVTLDVVPFPLIFANTFPGTCRGLCLTSQCPAPASPVGLCNTLPPREWFNRTLPLNCFWGEGVGCKECRLPEGIAGGNCTDGSCMFCPSGNVIVVKKGYWAPSVFSRPESVQACSPPAEIRCLGTPIPPSQSYSLQALVSPQCGKGYTGSYCTLCARGYYVSDSDAAGQSRTCESCPALSDYLRFLETFVITLSAVFAFFMAIYVLAVTLLHSCTVLHLTTWSYTAHYTLKSFVRLVLWGLVATQTASILFNRASAIAAPFLKQLYLILTALQYKGFDNPPLECISVPFPLLWGSILALGASYFFLFVLLPLAFCLPASAAAVGEAGSTSNLTRRGGGSAKGGSRGMAVRVGVGLRRVILFLATPAVLLLTLCFGAMTNAFADTVTCSPPVSITLDKYSSLGGDGSALPPGYPPLDDIRANDPATYYAQNVTVTVTLLVANPSLVCLEGSHIPAYYAAIGGLAGFTFLYPLILLALLHSRGVTLCALFHTPPKAMASSTPWPPSPHQGHSLDSPPSSGPPSSPTTSPRGGGGGVGAGGFPLDDKHAVEKNYFDFLLYLLIDPTVNHSKRVFQPLQYLMLASVSVLLRWGQTFPSSALAANVVLVLFTFAAAVVIKFFFRPYKDKLQWQNSSLASFYFLTAITALCMAVSQSSSSGSNTAVSWIFGLLPVIAAIATVMFVVYKWGRALLKNSQAELLKSQSKGGRSLQTAGAEEDSLVSDGGGGGEVQSYTDNPMGQRPRLEGIPLSGYEQQQEEGEVVVEEEPAIPPGSEIVGADFFNSTIVQSSRAGEDAWSPLRSRSEPDTSGGEKRGKEGDAWSPLVVEQAGFVPSGRVEDDSGDGNFFEGYVRPFGEVIPEAPEDKGVESSPIDSSQPSYHTSKLVELMKKHHRRSSRGSQRY